MGIEYKSTRDSSDATSTFEDVVMKGLATDGGLFVPTEIPLLPQDFLTLWKDLTFQELAFNIMRLYIAQSEIPDADLKDLVHRSYSKFRLADVTPLRKLDDDLYLLELFHGPTYAFKDVALQFVGNLFEYFLLKQNKSAKSEEERHRITVVGATSGDTGSAAIYGLRGKSDLSVFILYPTGRISPIQEEQMATVEDKNVHTLSVAGTFDDCQEIVKEIFNDKEFNDKYHIGAVNSINWARILAQMTYYFFSYFRLQKLQKSDRVRFVVPSGNFGDILAGFFAKKMGLPADKLIIATNENDILDRFIKTGEYARGGDVKATASPAMDILISSNFERLLWYLVREQVTKNSAAAGNVINSWMQDLKSKGSFSVPEAVSLAARADFASQRVSDEETGEEIRKVYEAHPDRYVLDPHSAVGVKVSYLFLKELKDAVYVSLSTAHPAKFAEVVNKSLKGIDGYLFEKDVLPDELKALAAKEKRCLLVKEVSAEKVKEVIVEELKKELVQ